MDFGAVGLDNGGLVCSENSNTGAAVAFAGAHQHASVAAETSKQKWYGSAVAAAGFLKQERSGNNTTTTATYINTNTTTTEDDFWRALKVPKTALISDDFFSSPSSSSSSAKSILRNPLLRSNSPYLSSDNNNNNNNNNFLSSDAHHQMLSFSSPNSSQSPLPFPYYHHPSSSSSSSIAFTARNASGYGNGGLTAGNIHGVLSGPRGPFTPSQWMELEHQALIYKYINANVPIPSYLLTPIRKALDSAGFSTFTGLRPNSFGWGAFHLGFSNSSDPEPGRCRRTDGKKWRCSRDAIADHKYCERHMNRGRHRSRKPVEGQSGHSISGTTNNTVKLMPVSSSPSAVVPGGGGASSNLGLSSQHQLKSSSVTTTSVTPRGGDNRNFLDKENLGERYQDTTGLSIISPAISMKENQYSISKQQNSYGESSRGEFGQVCSDSLLNPLNRSSSLVNCCNYGTSEDINERESESQRGFRQFMDDWPNSRPERSWPDVEMHSDRTQLSISIPMAASDFMSSTSSPTNEKLAASPLRLSREHDVTHMGLGLGCTADERNHRQANWIPISWESSMGGPLGEVLHNTNNGTGDGKNVSSLNLMSEGWDASPRLASSPTGVLQKAALVSLSNSSAGSSPRADNSKTHEGASLCSGALGSTLMNPASINH